eukprot:COSAG04_NODE_7461_length_1125_cov_2.268031_1_plen_56_part_10
MPAPPKQQPQRTAPATAPTEGYGSAAHARAVAAMRQQQAAAQRPALSSHPMPTQPP